MASLQKLKLYKNDYIELLRIIILCYNDFYYVPKALSYRDRYTMWIRTSFYVNKHGYRLSVTCANQEKADFNYKT